MNKFFLRAMFALLTLSLLLTACGKAQGDPTDPDDAAPGEESLTPDAQAKALYADFFSGNAATSSLLVNYSTEVSEASFRTPDVYVGADMDGVPFDWTIDRFALLDMDGDDVSELILSISTNGNGEYVVFTCCDGVLYANQLVYRGFLEPKADGTFGFSSGAMDNGYAHAHFESGVLVYDDFAAVSSGSDGSITYTINGETVDENAYNDLLAEQFAKPDLSWVIFSPEAIEAALEPNA